MTTNGDIPADAEMAECDGGQVVTMLDVLKEQQDFEDDANAVLGGSDEKECTYSQGYIKRQAIYACLSCCPESKEEPTKRAGFCLACSLTCHENHDLVELYTKRNFRCDCGNPKFNSPCQFTPKKPDLNEDNTYNQNFIGLYCICSKPYDHDSALDDEMIQCIICEDWWHTTHLDALVPANDQYEEMVCKLCMTKNEFIHDYSEFAVNTEGDVDIINDNAVDSSNTVDNLTNGSSEEKLSNGSVTEETLTNGIGEESMETSTVDHESQWNSNDDTSSPQEESTEPGKDNSDKVVDEKSINKPSDAPMETDETDKAAELSLEVSENNPEITSIDKTEKNETSDEKSESKCSSEELGTTSDEKLDEPCTTSDNKSDEPSIISENKSEQLITTSEDKTEDQVLPVNTTGNSEPSEEIQSTNDDEYSLLNDKENSETPKKNDSTAADSETVPKNSEVTEPEQDSNETKITEDETIAEKDQDDAEVTNFDKNDENPTDKTEATSPVKEMNESNTVSPDDDMTESKVTGNNVQESTVDTNDSKTEPETPETTVPELVSISTDNKRKMSIEDNNLAAKKPKIDPCIRPKDVKKVHKGATFWPATFRQKLCKCNECITMYKDLSVLFLIDLEDTVIAYETLGKERTAGKPNQYEKGIEALCSLGRIQQIDALTEYNKMRDKLLTFLQSFKDKKEVVTEHDIKTFFAGMKPEKRNDGVYFCG